MIERSLSLFNRLSDFQSGILFGPRGVGKSSLCLNYLENEENTVLIDLLNRETLRQHEDHLGLLSSIVKSIRASKKQTTIFIDEIQKLPSLLDDVHSALEENFRQNDPLVRFLVTGSSARKLKKGGANLLAGRAISLKLFPLTVLETEIIEADALSTGLLPAFYLGKGDIKSKLRAYAETYIREEVLQESIVRNVSGFSKFVELAAQMNGEPINFSRIGKAARISSTTVENFFTILVDILIARRIDVWSYSVRTQMTSQPKYYFFDCGVLNALRNELSVPVSTGTYRYGKLFETLVINQIAAINEYNQRDFNLYFWRTKGGAEIDLILSRGPGDSPRAIEIKSEQFPTDKELKILNSVKEEYPSAKLFCLCNTTQRTIKKGVEILPWREGVLEVLLD